MTLSAFACWEGELGEENQVVPVSVEGNHDGGRVGRGQRSQESARGGSIVLFKQGREEDKLGPISQALSQ